MTTAAVVVPLPVPTSRATVWGTTSRSTKDWRRIVFVFLPFAAGYYLSYLFRTINALISAELTSDLALSAADLGLLTSVFFLTFAAAQIPIGMLLDRYGPRRVQSALLLIAAAGAAAFGASDRFVPLILSRAMIGLGVAGALTAGLKAIVLWFPKERVALVNGYMVMLGAMGAVTATAPTELLIGWTGWRGLFELLAAATAASAVVIYFVVPEPLCIASLPKIVTPVTLKTVYTDRRFWRLAPLSATCAGSAWALQGLWAAPWLTDVERLDQASVITQLSVMAIALSVGAWLLGTVADRMRQRGVGPQSLLALAATLMIAAQLALILRLPLPSLLPWSVVAVLGSATVLSYGILAEYFPKELAGRANGALNVLHFGWAFVIQYATGLILEHWPSQNGHYPATAYQVAFALSVTFQIAALAWFKPLRLFWSFRALTTYRSTLEPLAPYQQAISIWTERLISARRQTRNWRFAALGSASLCAVLAIALAASAGRAEVTPYVLQVDHLNATNPSNPAISAPSDSQIAYFLARFVKNIRSSSTDPVVVRSNWIEALNYVTDGGAKALSDYAQDANPFRQIGLRPVEVEVLYVIRASDSSFEIHWKERAYEAGTLTRTDTFTGTAQIVLSLVTSADRSANPLGLYVHAFRWSRDTVR